MLVARVARVPLAVLLPEFVRKHHCHDEQRYGEENAQYHLLDHDSLHAVA